MIEILINFLPVSKLGSVTLLLLMENSLLSISSNPSLNQNLWGGEGKRISIFSNFPIGIGNILEPWFSSCRCVYEGEKRRQIH